MSASKNEQEGKQYVNKSIDINIFDTEHVDAILLRVEMGDWTQKQHLYCCTKSYPQLNSFNYQEKTKVCMLVVNLSIFSIISYKELSTFGM